MNKTKGIQRQTGKTKATILIIMLLMSTTTVVIFFDSKLVKADTGPPDDITVWFSSDWQNANHATLVADVNANVDFDITFNVGDLVNLPSNNAEWTYFHAGWDATVGTGSIIYKNYTHGNHESQYCAWPCAGGGGCGDPVVEWINVSRLCPTYESWMGDFSVWLNDTRIGPNYTYVYGNVLFIIMGMDYRTCLNGQDVYSAECWLDWCNETIQANQDMNIIILQHMGIETGSQTYYLGLVEQDEYYWIMQNYNVFAWIHGHTHLAPSVVELYGTYHLNDGKATSSSESSIIFDFVDGSDIVDIKKRNHASHSWTETISGYDTLTLDYAFDAQYEKEAELQFISIDGGTNGTTTYDSTPTFNWTNVSGAAMYNLQIANDSAFTELIVNITDINEYNYASKYDANDTRVSFTLPDTNALPVYKLYYCRVRAYT